MTQPVGPPDLSSALLPMLKLANIFATIIVLSVLCLQLTRITFLYLRMMGLLKGYEDEDDSDKWLWQQIVDHFKTVALFFGIFLVVTFVFSPMLENGIKKTSENFSEIVATHNAEQSANPLEEAPAELITESEVVTDPPEVITDPPAPVVEVERVVEKVIEKTVVTEVVTREQKPVNMTLIFVMIIIAIAGVALYLSRGYISVKHKKAESMFRYKGSFKPPNTSEGLGVFRINQKERYTTESRA